MQQGGGSDFNAGILDGAPVLVLTLASAGRAQSDVRCSGQQEDGEQAVAWRVLLGVLLCMRCSTAHA